MDWGASVAVLGVCGHQCALFCSRVLTRLAPIFLSGMYLPALGILGSYLCRKALVGIFGVIALVHYPARGCICWGLVCVVQEP